MPGGVNDLEGAGELQRDVEHALNRQRSLAHELAEVRSVERLHDEVLLVAGRDEVRDLDDVLGVDGVHRARLGEEALGDVVSLGELREQQLDGHLSSELHVLGEVDLRHAAFAEQPLDPVAPSTTPLGRMWGSSAVTDRTPET